VLLELLGDVLVLMTILLVAYGQPSGCLRH